MPTVFETMKRLFKGEPVFRPEEGDGGYHPHEGNDEYGQRASLLGHAEANRSDGKIAPIVIVNQTNCHVHDERMDLSVVVQNKHTQSVFVDKLVIMGHTWQLDRNMGPGEEHEFMFYKGGPRPKDTHNARAELWYRDSAGDYFASIHYVEFNELHDGMLTVSELRFLPPVKNV